MADRPGPDPLSRRATPGTPAPEPGGAPPFDAADVPLHRRLEEARRCVDRLRRLLETDAEERAVLHECVSARSALAALERTLRLERAVRRLPDALGAGEGARRARTEVVDLVLPRIRE